MKAPKGAVQKVLESVQRNYPDFQKNKDMNAMALVGMAHATGVVAAYFLHHQGERGLEKAIAMIATTIRRQAYEGDAMLRDKKHVLSKFAEK